MARKRTKLAMSATAAAQLKEQIRAATDPRDKERMQVVLWATSGQPTLAELAGLAGRARSTIQVWLGDLTAGGGGPIVGTGSSPRQAQPGGRSQGASRTKSRTKSRALAHGGSGGRLA